MIGGLTSGLSTALRTATAARATMDDMTRQIATGKRVASVKDDGAAWARANAMRSEQVQWEDRARTLDRVEVGLRATEAAMDAIRPGLKRLGELVLASRATLPGSDARRALQAEWQSIAVQTNTGGVNPGFADQTGYAIDAMGIGFQMNALDPFFSGIRFAAHSDLDGFGRYFIALANPAQNRPVRLSTFDLANASATQLDDAATTLNTMLGSTAYSWLSAWGNETGFDFKLVEALRATAQAAEDRLETQIGALTDADLGRASTARANAETRQALAMQTVRQALDTYQAKATGLLSNVQRTQRSVLA